MSLFNYLSCILILAFVSCNKSNDEKDTPACISNKITEFDRSSSCNSANVKQYTFKGETVFTFDPGTCGADMTTEVQDYNCNTLGYLGGITGNTKINGEDFSKATYIKTIWQK